MTFFLVTRLVQSAPAINTIHRIRIITLYIFQSFADTGSKSIPIASPSALKASSDFPGSTPVDPISFSSLSSV